MAFPAVQFFFPIEIQVFFVVPFLEVVIKSLPGLRRERMKASPPSLYLSSQFQPAAACLEVKAVYCSRYTKPHSKNN